jgi:DNA polymerase-3 subunit alpha
LDGAAKVEDMAKQAAAFGAPALALTDHGYMYGVPAFVDACKKEGVKPIVGCEVYFTPDSELRKDRKPELYHLILLAKDLGGYHNLLKLASKAATQGYYYKPRVTIEMLTEHAQGLLGTTACFLGIVPQMLLRMQREDALMWATKLSSVFAPGDFYVELQDQGITITAEELNRIAGLDQQNVRFTQGIPQRELNVQLTELARELGFKTVATNDMHYLRKEDSATQDLMLCINTGSKVSDEDRMRFSSDQFYMKSEEEMRKAMRGFEEACDTTLEIAEKCNFELPHDIILPVMPLPEGETEGSMLYKQALAGLEQRYGAPLPQEVSDRFEYEYKIICDQGFPAYFLVVQEFVDWAKKHNVGVGPGRGSAAGSIISYALGITALDPLSNGLLFERFLSPERAEMPDIDIDFDEDGRFDVIEHLRELYGEEKVAHVITYNTMAAKAAIKDATRVLGYDYNVGDKISKMISKAPGTTLKGTLGIHEKEARNKAEKNPDLVRAYGEDGDIKRVVDAALSLEGFIRGEGVHACAVIICRDPVTDHVPIKLDTKDKMIITQYDGEHNASLGLLKMDFLGLRTLNVLMKACEYVKANHGVSIDIDKIPLDDPKSFEIMRRGDTPGLFQIESGGMTSLVRRMNVDKFDDIVAAIALFRPGPLNSGFLDAFVERRVGKKKIVYYDDRLKDILAETYGTIVYQEQVMRISMAMSGFTAGESDRLRKAVAKKKIDLMTKKVQLWADGVEETMKDHWLNGAVRNGYEAKTAQQIWDDVEKFAEYAFNKSHSAAYAVLVMQTAWVKAYYPIEYMAAVLSSYMGKTDKLTHYINACKQANINVMAPDINSSRREFTPTPEGIRFGLAGIKGVGEGAADEIIAEREANGSFVSLHDFVFRVPNRLCNKRTVESLIKAGAFDSTGYTRKQMIGFLEVDNLMDVAAKRHQDKADGQVSMFDMFEEAGVDSGFEDKIPEPDGVEWDRMAKLETEKEVLGLYVSDHPVSPYADVLKEVADCSLGVFMDEDGDEGMEDAQFDEGATTDKRRDVLRKKNLVLAGMVTGLSTAFSKKNNKRYARFSLEDMEGQVDAIMFPQYYDETGHLLADGAVVEVACRYEADERGKQVLVNKVKKLDLEARRPVQHRALVIHVPSAAFNQEASDSLLAVLREFPGGDMVSLCVEQSDNRRFKAELPLTVDSRSPVLGAQIRSLFGEEALRV